jgi:phosphonate transport system substrate-binding protein
MIGPTMSERHLATRLLRSMPRERQQRNKSGASVQYSRQPHVRPLHFANFLAPNMSSVYAYVAMRLGRVAGGSTFAEGISLDELRDGSVDVAFLCGLPYVRLSRDDPTLLAPLAAPVLAEPRYEGQPIYFSDVIVRRDSPFESFADLRGRSWAHSREDSFSGCLLARYHLREMMETAAFFGSVTYSGSNQKSIRAVVDGEVEAAAIDSHVLAVERRNQPELDKQVRVIAVLGPSPIPPVVASTRLGSPLQARLREAICGLHQDPIGRQVLGDGVIQRYTPIDDSAYDDIRRKLDAVEGSVSAVERIS